MLDLSVCLDHRECIKQQQGRTIIEVVEASIVFLCLPEVKPVPELFQEAGYYTCIGSGLLDLDYRSQPLTDRSRERMGKTDYNFDWKRSIYDGNDWSGRRSGQPFFMQVQLHGGKLRGASEEAYDAFRQQAYSLLGNVTDPG